VNIKVCLLFLLRYLTQQLNNENKLNSVERKYTILKTILQENSISLLYGDDEDYFEKLNLWINNSLQ
jgi:hypothetical protein